MAGQMNPEQKKQALILLLLVGALGAVFFILDPLGVMKKEPQPVVTPPQPATNNPGTPATPANPGATKQPAAAPVLFNQVSIIKGNKKHLELLPPINQIIASFAYKMDPFNLTTGGKATDIVKNPITVPTIKSISGINRFKVRFNELTGTDNRQYFEGETFKYKGKSFRILNINQTSQSVEVIDENDAHHTLLKKK